ncbi:MAG: zinc-ribbon domain-containing protein [Bryobacteraceae bacterium]
MNHCTNCGSPLAAGSTFCTRCGARVGAPSPAAAPPPHPPAAPPPAKGSGLGKILLIAGGIFVFLGLLVVGGLIYAGYKVKQKVENITGGAVPAATARARRVSDPCALLPAAEAARITGFQIERTEVEEQGCAYYGSASRAAEQGQKQAEEAMRKMRANEAKDEREAARVMEDFMKGMAASGAAGESKEVLKITVKYGDEARQEESAVRLALGMMGASQGAKGSSVEGVGDRAYLLPMAVGLHMAKGDAYVMIEGVGIPNREVLVAVARAIAGRL